MINKKSTALILIFELALLAITVTINITNPGDLNSLTEILLFALTIGNLGIFYNVIVQKKTDNTILLLLIQFLLINMFTLSQLITNKTNWILGIISTVICCINILVTSLSKDKKKYCVKKDLLNIEQKENQLKEIIQDKTNKPNLVVNENNTQIIKEENNVIINKENKTGLSKFYRSDDLYSEEVKEDKPILSPNIVNVNIKESENKKDDKEFDELKENDKKINENIEKVKEKFEVINLNVDKKLEDMGTDVKDRLDDVKHELDNLKKKEKKLFIVSKGGKKIHNPNCMIAQRIPKEKRILLDNVQDAIQDGYSPCSVCVPIQTISLENNE